MLGLLTYKIGGIVMRHYIQSYAAEEIHYSGGVAEIRRLSAA